MAAPTVNDKKGRRPTGGYATGCHVVVLSPDGAVRRTLPPVGEVLIGRDEDADIRVLDPRASRHHARIILDDAIAIEDLGSANGTRMRDRRLEAGKPVPFTPGDAIAIGGTILLLQAGEPEHDERRVWAHGYLETRLVEECARAQSRGSQFALARIHVQSGPAGGAPRVLVEQILSNALRDGDLIAMYAPGEYEALLLDCEEASSRALANKIVALLAAQSIPSICGLAFYPADGTSPQSLVGRASESARVQAGGAPVSPGVIIESPAMRELYALARRAAAGDSNVLIAGETGAGKEVLAETVHRASPRAGKPFLPINCAAFSESLVESELFGFERGAFTGANQTKIGLLEAASGGTLFLDEIGEMPLAVQAKLLRVIETRQVLRIGATKARAIDVRFVAATNRDLEEEVAEKRFREDLYFRLNVIALEIPPLRERPEEIEILARLFLDRLAASSPGRPAPALSDEALSRLRAYAWPGNIRELRNVIERAFVLCTGPIITVEHLPVDKMRHSPRTATEPAGVAATAATPPSAAAAAPPPPAGAPRAMKQIERDAMVDALDRCHGNQTRAAELLGMPRRTFCKRMREFELPRPRS
jgi:two-component system response regulator AtoC